MRRAGPGPAAGGPCASPACGAGLAASSSTGSSSLPKGRRREGRAGGRFGRFGGIAALPARLAIVVDAELGAQPVDGGAGPDARRTGRFRCRRCRRVPIGAYGIRRSRNHIVSGRCHLGRSEASMRGIRHRAVGRIWTGGSDHIGQAPGAQRRQGVGIDRRVTGCGCLALASRRGRPDGHIAVARRHRPRGFLHARETPIAGLRAGGIAASLFGLLAERCCKRIGPHDGPPLSLSGGPYRVWVELRLKGDEFGRIGRRCDLALGRAAETCRGVGSFSNAKTVRGAPVGMPVGTLSGSSSIGGKTSSTSLPLSCSKAARIALTASSYWA